MKWISRTMTLAVCSVLLVGSASIVIGLAATAAGPVAVDGSRYGPDTGRTGIEAFGPLSAVAGVFRQSITDEQIVEAKEYLVAQVTAQGIVGRDDRVRVTDTTVAPYRSVVHLVKFVNGKVDSLCTGAFVATDLILTAAHCIQDSPTSPRADDFLIVPAENDSYWPFGTALSSDWVLPQAWIDSHFDNVVYDIALLKVANSQLGRTVGILGVITAMTDADLSSANLNAFTVGYPGDKPPGTMWWSGVSRLMAIYPDALVYDFDIAPGQSGSVIFRQSDRRIFSIVSEGCEPAGRICHSVSGNPLFNNFSVRISVPVARALADYAVSMGSTLYYEVPIGPPPTPTLSATSTRAPTATPTGPPSPASFPPPPPSTFYGIANGAVPGGAVIAIVMDGTTSTVCGDGVVLSDSGVSVYVVTVVVDAQRHGCGKAGRQVWFYFTPVGGFGGRLATNAVSWSGPGAVSQPLTLDAPVRRGASTPLVAKDGAY